MGFRHEAKRLIKQSKRSTELHLSKQSKMNPMEFYSFIRQMRVITTGIGPVIYENGDYTNDEEQIRNVLNTFFASVFRAEDLSDILAVSAVQIDNNDVLSSTNITESDVSQCIDKFKVSHPGLRRSHPAP